MQMTRIKVSVHMDEKQMLANKRLFERIIDVAGDIMVSYQEIQRTLFFLFGEKAIINIQIHQL